MRIQYAIAVLPWLVLSCGDASPDRATELPNEVEVVGFVSGQCNADEGDPKGDGTSDEVPELGEEPECVKAWRDDRGIVRLSFVDLHGNCAVDWDARANVPADGQLNILLHNKECRLARCSCPFDLGLEVDAPGLPEAIELQVTEENCDGVRADSVRKVRLSIGGEQVCFAK